MVFLCGSAQDLRLDSKHADSDSKQQQHSKIPLHVDEMDAVPGMCIPGYSLDTPKENKFPCARLCPQYPGYTCKNLPRYPGVVTTTGYPRVDPSTRAWVVWLSRTVTVSRVQSGPCRNSYSLSAQRHRPLARCHGSYRSRSEGVPGRCEC
eukprot:1352722-Rhodomonas_salina.1